MITTYERLDVCYVVEQTAACAWYRCRTPGTALAALGYRIDVCAKPSVEKLRNSRVVVFERPSTFRNHELCKMVKSHGIPLVIELDDDLWHIDPTNPAYRHWTPETLARLEDCLRHADVVTVTTEALADTVSVFNRNVAVLPNMLPRDHWPVRSPRKSDTVVIGWAGSATHYRDLAMLKGIIEQTLERYPHVEFHTAGARELPFTEHPRIVKVPPVSLEDYPSLIATFDIGLAPVLDTRFNRAKSDLKALEYGACSVPVIASATETYASLPREAGFLCKTPADWLGAMKRLVERPELRAFMGAAGRVWAESRTIEKHGHLWERAYGLEGEVA